MGLFFNKGSGSTERNGNTKPTIDKAINYFSEQQIRCKSEVDRKAIRKLYEALEEDNYDTTDDNSLVSALSSLDANMYNLCKALINQNFMMMRKLDELSDKIDRLER